MSRTKQRVYDPEVIKALMVVIESTRAEVSDAMQAMILEELVAYPKHVALKALHKCLKELRPGQFYMGAVIDRIDMGHPSIELAWAMASKACDEREPVLWTDMMAHAWGQVSSLVADGDKIAARMAFKECYGAALEEAQLSRRMAVWEISPGHDRNRTNEVLAMAVAQGHLSFEQAEVLALPTPSLDEAAIERREEQEKAKLLTHSPTVKDAQGKPSTVAEIVAGLKGAREEAERQRNAAQQAETEHAIRRKAEAAQRVQEYAKAKGISLFSLPGCQACAAAETDPTTGLSHRSCPDCQAREIANGPFAFAAKANGKANKGIESGLSSTWTDMAAGIARVHEWMAIIKRHKEASCQK